MCYVLNKNMETKPPPRAQHPRRITERPVATQVVMDAFSDLWIQYEDGRWRWVSLIGLVDKKPYRPLIRREVFRVGTLSHDRRWIEWSSSLRLHVDHLDGPIGELTPKGVVVRAAGETTFDWFRPLFTWHAKQVRRQRLIGRPGPPHLSDRLILEWLGWSGAQLDPMFAAYATSPDAVAARFLDLLQYLGVVSPPEAAQLRAWLYRPWIYPGYATPWGAIVAGDIALVERLYINETARRRNFGEGLW